METSGKPASTSREVVGVFMGADHLNKAVEDLQAAGFHRDEIGLVASEYAVQQRLGQVYCRVAESPDPARNPEAAYIKRESAEDTVHGLSGGLYFVGGTAAAGALVASAAILGGPLVVALAAAAAVGTVGAVVGSIISKSEADFLREQIDEGHMLVCVRLGDPAREREAKDILARNAALHVKTYDTEAKSGRAS